MTKTQLTKWLLALNCLWLAFPAIAAAEAPNQPINNLQQLYTQALLHDPTWAAARFANEAAQEKLAQGKALLRPKVALTSTANRANTQIKYIGNDSVFRNNNQADHFNTLTYGVNASQPLYRKQNSVQFEQSGLQVSLADLQLQQDKQDLMLKAVQAYFDVLLAQDKLELNAAQKAALSSQLGQAQANFKAGVAMITDVDEAQAKYDMVNSEVIAIGNDLENKKRAVQILTGQYPASLFAVRDDLRLSSPAAPTMQTQSSASSNDPETRKAAPSEKTFPIQAWIETAIQNNPALNSARLSYAYAQKELELNQAGHLPTLDAVASYSRTYADGGINGFGNDLHNATIGLQFELPLYQGGAISSKVREAAANLEKAQLDIEAAMRKTEMDTRQAYLDIASSIAQVQSAKQSLHSTETQLKSTEKSAMVGLRTNVDILNAQQQVFNAKRDLLQARYSYLTGMVKLKYVAGVLQDGDIEEVNQELVKSD